jgi:hypothetical protein
MGDVLFVLGLDGKEEEYVDEVFHFSLLMKVVEGINAVASGWKALLVLKNSALCLHLFVNHHR